jgi:hypothetical protein
MGSGIVGAMELVTDGSKVGASDGVRDCCSLVPGSSKRGELDGSVLAGDDMGVEDGVSGFIVGRNGVVDAGAIDKLWVGSGIVGAMELVTDGWKVGASNGMRGSCSLKSGSSKKGELDGSVLVCDDVGVEDGVSGFIVGRNEGVGVGAIDELWVGSSIVGAMEFVTDGTELVASDGVRDGCSLITGKGVMVAPPQSKQKGPSHPSPYEQSVSEGKGQFVPRNAFVNLSSDKSDWILYFQAHKSCLNDIAPSNIFWKFSFFFRSQEEISWLKEMALPNVYDALSSDDVSHLASGWLKLVAPNSIKSMFVTLLTSQSEISSLKKERPINKVLNVVIWETSQHPMGTPYVAANTESVPLE